jgi:hypothetical protein
MKPSYWQQQNPNHPLFPGMLWSRPENRQLAGKLLIIGGSAHGFAVPAEAFVRAGEAGAGTVRVILPSALAKTIGHIFEAGEYAPSTPSGSFAQNALAEILSLAQWAGAVLLAGDFGRNSETAILLEKFVAKYQGIIAITGDGLDYFLANPYPLLAREHTLLLPTFAQLQKLSSAAHATRAFTSQLDLVHFVEILHSFSTQYPHSSIAMIHNDHLFVATGGMISTTAHTRRERTPADTQLIAAYAAVWFMQNPLQPYPALSCAMATLA